MTDNVESVDNVDDDGLPSLGGFGLDDSAHEAEPNIQMPPVSSGFSDEPTIVTTDSMKIPSPVAVDDPPIAAAKTDSQVHSRSGKDDYLGRTFGGYELVEVIGQGGMGTVYKGRQVSLDRTVAVKLLLPALVTNDEFIRRFEREAKSIARLSHPNIVAVLDFGVSEDGLYYMVIEYVQGTSLSAMISDRLMMTFAEFLPVISQCLAGLDYVSRHGVIHRDIKPDNILVNDTGVAKLADFGLAKDVSDNNNDTDLTSVGSAMGTPAYMSPEQCMGRTLDVRSDIYAFGVTAYLALTGEKPFTGNSGFEVMTKQREYVPPTPAELNPQIHQKISALIMRMLEKKAANRFKTAEECRDHWLQIGEELHVVVPSNMRSGEWDARESGGATDSAIPVPVDLVVAPAVNVQPVHVNVDLPTRDDGDDPFSYADDTATSSVAPPPSGTSSDQHRVSSQSVRRSVGTTSAPHFATHAAPALPSASAPLPVAPAPLRASPDVRRSGSEFNDSSEMRVCSQCGAQNRIHYSRCQQCAHNFSDDAQGSIDDQMKQADNMERQGRYKNAMELYAKLADQTDDRRLRSVIRSKERGARTAYEDIFFEKVSQQSEVLRSNGDIKGGIALLEREIESTDSSALSERLSTQVSTLRVALKKKGGFMRLFFWLFLILVIAAGAAYMYREKIPLVNNFVNTYLGGLGDTLPTGETPKTHDVDVHSNSGKSSAQDGPQEQGAVNEDPKPAEQGDGEKQGD